MADKWIQGAVKHPGALRATAKSKGIVSGDEPLSEADLSKLEQGNELTAKRARLARVLKSLAHKD